jgi:hypothetical protein
LLLLLLLLLLNAHAKLSKTDLEIEYLPKVLGLKTFTEFMPIHLTTQLAYHLRRIN